MSDLISRSELIEMIKGTEQLLDFQKDECIACINSCDTAYDIDKVVSKLEKLADESYKAYCIGFNSDDRAEYDAYTNAIEIVKQGGVTDDCCEWTKHENTYNYKSYTHSEMFDSRVLDWEICPYCKKKIKVVE